MAINLVHESRNNVSFLFNARRKIAAVLVPPFFHCCCCFVYQMTWDFCPSNSLDLAFLFPPSSSLPLLPSLGNNNNNPRQALVRMERKCDKQWRSTHRSVSFPCKQTRAHAYTHTHTPNHIYDVLRWSFASIQRYEKRNKEHNCQAEVSYLLFNRNNRALDFQRTVHSLNVVFLYGFRFAFYLYLMASTQNINASVDLKRKSSCYLREATACIQKETRRNQVGRFGYMQTQTQCVTSVMLVRGKRERERKKFEILFGL